jgi:hypothetical protein
MLERHHKLLVLAAVGAVFLLSIGLYRREFYRSYTHQRAMRVVACAAMEYLRTCDRPPSCVGDLLDSGALTLDAAYGEVRSLSAQCGGPVPIEAVSAVRLSIPACVDQYEISGDRIVGAADRRELVIITSDHAWQGMQETVNRHYALQWFELMKHNALPVSGPAP